MFIKAVRPICKILNVSAEPNSYSGNSSIPTTAQQVIRQIINMRIRFDCSKALIIIAIGLVVSIEANNSTSSWWQGIPHALTDILTMKMNIFTALPLELAATTIDTLCK